MKTEYRKRRQIEVCENRLKTEESLKTKRNESFKVVENGFSVQAGNCITISEREKTDLRYSCKEQNLRKQVENSSSEKEHKENALALGADEGRDKLR